MIQLFFSLRYQSQIRRTNPELYRFLEKTLVDAIAESGGTLVPERRFIAADFDDSATGFWLGILNLLETLHRSLFEAAPELFGHVCIMAPDLGESGGSLAWSLPAGGSGIWCGSPVRRGLEDWVEFEKAGAGEAKLPEAADLARIARFRSGLPDGKTGMAGPANHAGPKLFPYRKRIINLLRQGGQRNVLLQGPRFIGKRGGIRDWAGESSGGIFFPLSITFGAGGRGLSCIADALSPETRRILSGPESGEAPGTAPVSAELANLAECICRERFQDEYPVHALVKTRRFFGLLLETWETRARFAGQRPVLILENLNEADESALRILCSVLGQRPGGGEGQPGWQIFGTWSGEPDGGNGAAPESLGGVFSGLARIFLEEGPAFLPVEEMNRDLLETAYSLALFRRYFPPPSFPELFREAGLNPRMIARAMEMLAGQGIIDSTLDPQIRIPDFILLAERFLGNRKEKVRGMVSRRIFAWVGEGKLRPSFRLLEILHSLGGFAPGAGGLTGTAASGGSGQEAERILDSLILDGLRSDIINNTCGAIEEAFAVSGAAPGSAGSHFAEIVGERRAPVLVWLFRTCRALHGGGETAIREAFLQPPPDAEAFPHYKAQVHANLAAFHFGFRDIAAAEEMVKETMLLSQGRGTGLLSQAYRLFSLVSIARQRISDASDYLGFAVENCARSGNQDELAQAAWYAAATWFLFGNLSRAERLAGEAWEAASQAGRLEWADRALFLQGRFRFEAGRYQEARTIFETLARQERSWPGGACSGGRAAVLEAWSYRSAIFAGERNIREPELPSLDGRFFSIEAAWLRGDCAGAVARAETFQGTLPESRFVFIEQPDWWSGFAQCEFLVLEPEDFFARLASSYRALALCRLDGSGDTRGEAMDSIRRAIREEGSPLADPNDAFYHYVRYRVLEECGATEVDMNTAISMAFKRLQSRASRIEDTETKRAWLFGNYWNGALSQAARKHKLI